jgi:hypothetical protein
VVPRLPLGAYAVEFDDGYGGVVIGEVLATVPLPDTGATVPFDIVNGAVPGGVENGVGKALEAKGIVDPVAPTPPSVGLVEAVEFERVKGGLGSPEGAVERPVPVGPGNDVAFVNQNGGEAVELGWLPEPSSVPLLALVGFVTTPAVHEVKLLTGIGNQVPRLDPVTLGAVPVGPKTEVELIFGKGATVLGEVDVGFGIENGFLSPVLLRIVEVPVASRPEAVAEGLGRPSVELEGWYGTLKLAALVELASLAVDVGRPTPGVVMLAVIVTGP